MEEKIMLGVGRFDPAPPARGPSLELSKYIRDEVQKDMAPLYAAFRPGPTPEQQTKVKWDRRFLDLAKLVASWSRDPSTQTGAVFVDKHKRVLSVGFNGFPQPMVDLDEHYSNREEKYSRIVHCEVNALIFAGRLPEGSTLYTWPFMSCDRCVVQMLQAGVRRFVAPVATADQLTRWGSAFAKTRQYLRECGAELIEIDTSEGEAA